MRHRAGPLSSTTGPEQLALFQVHNADAALVCSCIQVLVEPTTFLLLISVAMFFPGLPSPALRAHSSCSHQAAPRLVAHHSLDSFGQSSHIFLANKRKPYLGYQQSPLEGMYSTFYENSKIVGVFHPSLVLASRYLHKFSAFCLQFIPTHPSTFLSSIASNIIYN